MSNQIKPVLPTLREKKRYLAFEIVSKSKIKDFSQVSGAFWGSLLSFAGELGAAKAGMIVMQDKFNSTTQKGVIRINHKYVDYLRASLALVKQIEGNDVIVRSLTVSGMLNKAAKYTAG
ncbi:ribonuclease P protein component 2 [Candidatus Woesearchaeota archaeon]|nr:ribonuclease P protein component 2 [Candidatus Woesearchaeota archaeon]